MRKLKIFLGDLGYTNKYTREYTYVPLNIGYVAQYVTQLYGADVEIKLFKDPEKLLFACRHEKPDVLGLSFYYWNTDINHAIVKRLRAERGTDLTILWGGSSVGTDKHELTQLFVRFPEVDAFVINEGELGFAELIKERLATGPTKMWTKPLDGSVFWREGLVQGLPVGLTLELDKLQSPYLSGILDEFLVGDFQPLIQTSRLCPYTCAFCTSGKNRGKLRAFPMDQVKAEIDLIAKKFADRTHMTFLLSDENFGILHRDVEMAEYIAKTSEKTGYPQSVFFYNDKRFTETSKQVIESLGNINSHGLILSLQSENPETLKEVKRRNLTKEDIESALKWASDRKLSTSTELIFGMPYETRKSFVDLMRTCVERGFDSILGFNLFLMDGIELNTPQSREKFKVKTMFRPVGTYFGPVEGEFCAESEEIVVSSSTFSYEDFLFIRSINFMFYTVFALNFYKYFFQYIRHSGVDFVAFMLEFICPTEGRGDVPAGQAKFTKDFRKAITEELYETRADVKKHMEENWIRSGREVKEPIRQNVFYGARLIYMEYEWLHAGLLATLRKFIDPAQKPEVWERAQYILDLCARERIALRENKTPEPMESEFDFDAWKTDKYKFPLENYPMPKQAMAFVTRKDILNRIENLRKNFGDYDDHGFYYAAMDFMQRRDLLYSLDYPSLRKVALQQLVPGARLTASALGAQTV
jgi:radical SAM superfamily enzyme YgiQ (UPF0313 family)